LIASFDIECSSSHGDFPLAKKNYKKLSAELYDKLKKSVKLNNDRKSDKKNILNNLVNAFKYTKSLNIDDISYVFTKNKLTPTNNDLKYVSSQIYNILVNQENYKILARDVLKYYYNTNYSKLTLDSTKKIYVDKTATNIKDAFTNDYDDKNNKNNEKNNKYIQTIYTKVNKKPSFKKINSISEKCAKQINILFKKSIINCRDYEIDNDTINDFIGIYFENLIENNTVISNKIIDEFPCFEDEPKLVTLMIADINMCINNIYSYLQEGFPEIDNGRDSFCKRIQKICDDNLPPVEGDKVIQIGTTIQRFGEKKCFLKHIITLKGCSKIDGAVVESYDNEDDVLCAWQKFIQKLDPDIITGYNIFGFDFAFMFERAEELNCVETFTRLGRMRINRYIKDDNGKSTIENNTKCYNKMVVKKLASAALGDNTLRYIEMDGRILMDLLKVVQKDFNLVSYKLDNVAENFINDKITHIDNNTLTINGITTLQIGNYITLNYGHDKQYKNKKFKITYMNEANNTITLNDTIEHSLLDERPTWNLAKDDVSPQDIFRLQEGSDDDRKIVAVYCIQDCALCNYLIDKLKLITNNIGMANVCSVPLSYLFLRGQGVKIFSLVSHQCRKEGFLIPVVKHKKDEVDLNDLNSYKDNTNIKRNIFEDKSQFEFGIDDDETIDNGDEGYEGAIVLKPNPGLYLKTPVTVLDYASLYPSSMISENLSHDSLILENNPETKKYLGESGIEELDKIGYGYVDRQYDIFRWKDPKIKSKGKEKCGIKVCRFVQPKDGSKCVIPNKLRELLKARKSTRKKITFKTITTNDNKIYSGLLNEINDTYNITDTNGVDFIIKKTNVVSIKDTYNDFEKSVFDGLQLAFKMTANSLYGQIGASTSPISLKEIAASTTATGRELLYLAKEKVEEHFDGAEIVYGDTDSIFIDFKPKDSNGKLLENKEALKRSIELGVEAEKYIQPFLKAPHKLEYEKTFWPFILFSKKRYIGNKYEFKTGEKDYKETSMGIVLKRRDNAEIVKHVYGGVIDILMNKKNLELSIKFLQDELFKLMNGKFNLDMLIVTKSLRGYYKNPDSIAHKVLADRMGIRDPGNKPSSNDRIPYVYIQVKEDKNIKILQGNRIEHPQFIIDNNLKPDYKFYITNQIMKPVTQIYSLIVEQLNGFKYEKDYFDKKYKYLLKKNEGDVKKTQNKIDDLKFKEASNIIFEDVMRVSTNRKNNSRTITEFFKVNKK
jgi:DNA polymerase elongation subunit (family B)